MIFVTGDIHGSHSIAKLSSDKFPAGKTLTKNDYVIIAGDFGLVWTPQGGVGFEDQQYWLKWLNDKPWTTLFVDGNHENFELLNAHPEIEAFGSKVGRIRSSVFHLKRGRIYTIDGKKIWAFGGGYSYDKGSRTPYRSWWPDEMPTYAEMESGMNSLEAAQFKVDYIISHTAPQHITEGILSMIKPCFPEPADGGELSLRKYFHEVADKTEFKHWYFGHFHVDMMFGDQYQALYHKVLEVK
jgi:predicted phosphohydrolase